MNRIIMLVTLAALAVVSACGVGVVSNVPLKPSALKDVPAEKLPCRVALIADPAIRQVKALKKETFMGDAEYMITTMPNFYLGVLAANFEEVEIKEPGEDLEGFDLAARMEVRKWEIQGAATIYSANRVEIDFHFEITDVKDGKVVFTDDEGSVRWINYQDAAGPNVKNPFLALCQEIVDSAFEMLSKRIGASEELKNVCRQ
ncbi:MAG: hypothetical protein AB1921_06480 [Thermodesulfobacteriota bacterium]